MISIFPTQFTAKFPHFQSGCKDFFHFFKTHVGSTVRNASTVAVETSPVMVKVMAHLDKCRNEAYLMYPHTLRVTLLNNVTSLVRWS